MFNFSQRNLTVKDFIHNRLEVRVQRLDTRVQRLETLIEKEDQAPKTKKICRRRSDDDDDDDELSEDDRELLKLLRDPLERRRLRRNIENVKAKRTPALKQPLQKGAKKRKISNSESEESDAGSSDDRLTRSSSVESIQASP